MSSTATKRMRIAHKPRAVRNRRTACRRACLRALAGCNRQSVTVVPAGGGASCAQRSSGEGVLKFGGAVPGKRFWFHRRPGRTRLLQGRSTHRRRPHAGGPVAPPRRCRPASAAADPDQAPSRSPRAIAQALPPAARPPRRSCPPKSVAQARETHAVMSCRELDWLCFFLVC